MRTRGLFSLIFLFGVFNYLFKLIHARSNVLHDGVLDSLSYDPGLLSMLQMEQSLDLDDDEASYLGTSLLDNEPSFLQHSSKHLGPSLGLSSSSFLEDSSSLQDDDDDLVDDDSFLEETSEDVDDDGDDESLLEVDEFADDESPSLLESSSSSSDVDDDTGDDGDLYTSFLQTTSSFSKPSSNSFGSLVQLHNFDTPDPLNFLQDDTLLVLNDDDQSDLDLEEESPKKSGLKAFVLKSDFEEPDMEEMSDSLDSSTAEKVLSVLAAYKVWLIVLTVLLSIALVVRLFYLDKFLKFKNELMAKVDNLNKVVASKFSSVFKKNQANSASTESEETPLLSA